MKEPLHFSKNPRLGDVEKMAMAAVAKISFFESGVKDTPQNRKDFEQIVKDFSEAEKSGFVFDIPV